jgi:hypothetical protein
MEEMRHICVIVVGNRKGNEHLEDVDVDGTIVGILDGLIRNYSVRIAFG